MSLKFEETVNGQRILKDGSLLGILTTHDHDGTYTKGTREEKDSQGRVIKDELTQTANYQPRPKGKCQLRLAQGEIELDDLAEILASVPHGPRNAAPAAAAAPAVAAAVPAA